MGICIIGRGEVYGANKTNFTGFYGDVGINGFNGVYRVGKFSGDCRLGSSFYCGEGRVFFNRILITRKLNGLARMTNRRTFHSLPGNMFPKSNTYDYIAPSSTVTKFYFNS